MKPDTVEVRASFPTWNAGGHRGDQRPSVCQHPCRLCGFCSPLLRVHHPAVIEDSRFMGTVSELLKIRNSRRLTTGRRQVWPSPSDETGHL